MGLEIENLKNVKGIWDPNDVSIGADIKAVDEKLEIGVEMNGVEKDAVNVDTIEKSTEKVQETFVNALDKKLQEDENSVFLPGASLTAFINENVKDAALRKEVDECIKEIENMTPEQYLKEFKRTERSNPVMHKLLEVYVRGEMVKAIDKLDDYMLKDKSVSFSRKIENVKQGFYEDDNGVIQDLGLERDRTKGHVYPANDYEKDALYRYETEILAPQMDVMMRVGLLKLEKEGKLKDLKYNADLTKAIVEAVEGPGASDPVFEKYISKRGDIGKLARRHDAVMKRREELKHVTMDEIEKKLKKSTIESLKTYMEAHKNADGTYDLSEISVVIQKRVGYDFLVNRNDDGSKTLAELHLIRTGLAAVDNPIVDSEKFDHNSSYKQTKDLIAFCGYEMESRNHTPSIIEAAEAVFIGGVSSLISHVAAPQATRITISKHLLVEQYVSINGQIQAENIVDKVRDVKVDISRWKNVLEAVESGIVSAVVIQALEELIFGRDIAFERECFDKSDFDRNDKQYTIKENYINYLKNKDKIDGTDSYARMKFLLDKFPAKEDGTWDYDSFFNFLRTIAGLGTNLNCAEIAGFKMYGGEEQPVEPAKPQLIKTTTTEQVKEPDKKVEYSYDEKVDSKFTSEHGIDKAKWSTFADNIYDCEEPSLQDVYPKLSDRIRVIKLAQCIKDGNDNEDSYSKERMDELLKLSKTNPQKLRTLDYFDADAYFGYTEIIDGKEVKIAGVLTGHTLPQEIVRDKDGNVVYDRNGKPKIQFVVKLPPVLAGVKRCENITPDMFDANVAKTAVKVNEKVTSSRFNSYSGEKTVEGGMVDQTVYSVGIAGSGTSYDYTNDQDGFNKKVDSLQKETGTEAKDVKPDEFKQQINKPEEEPKE